MESPRLPHDESERLASLRTLDLLDTPAEERFDRITRLAKALFDVPLALLSLVDQERQWFKSRQGLTACSTPREVSFCGHAILQREIFLVPDALRDDRFRDNPLVTGAPHVRFYAGYPLRDAKGHCLGTLCIIDHQPRQFSDRQMALLTDLGRIAESEISGAGRAQREARGPWPPDRRDKLDAVTGTWNEQGIREIVELELARCAEQSRPVTILHCSIDGDSKLAENWTVLGSDIVLSEVAQVLRGCLRTSDPVGRWGERCFLMVLPGLSAPHAPGRIFHLRSKLEQNPVMASIGVHVQIGFACVEPDRRPVDVEALLVSIASAPVHSLPGARASSAA